MNKDFKKELIAERKKRLGLTDNVDTKKVFYTILESYKKIFLDAPNDVYDYCISFAITNMNGYNRLGTIEELFDTWGDIFIIDKNNSGFITQRINDSGQLECEDSIDFNDIENLKDINKIWFSIKELIELCKEYDFEITIFSRDDLEATTIEIDVLKSFRQNNSIVKYLKLEK